MDKIIFFRKDQGLDKLNELLSEGWKLIQMSVTAENDSAGCYSWIRKENKIQKFGKEESHTYRKTDLLSPISIDTRGWKFDKEEANER